MLIKLLLNKHPGIWLTHIHNSVKIKAFIAALTSTGNVLWLVFVSVKANCFFFFLFVWAGCPTSLIHQNSYGNLYKVAFQISGFPFDTVRSTEKRWTLLRLLKCWPMLSNSMYTRSLKASKRLRESLTVNAKHNYWPHHQWELRYKCPLWL